MSQQSDIRAETDAAALSLSCLAHMEQEEAMLGETLESLQQVRAALIEGSLISLSEALERQARISRAAAELRERRDGLRRDLADTLGTPPQAVTLQMLAVRLSGHAGQRLARGRERLHTMAVEVERLNRANAALVSQSLDFLQRFFVEITGGEQSGKNYSRAGTPEPTGCGSIIEARG